MRIALKAEVIADMVVNEPVVAKLYPYDFEIYKENAKLWLKVTKPVKDYEEYLPQVTVKNGRNYINFGSDDIFKDLFDWLQYIEAMGSFNIQVEQVCWNNPTFYWIAETEEERLKTPVTQYTRSRTNGKRPKLLKSDNLSNIVIYRKQLKDINIPFTYYKEGQKFFNHFNYYFAYINFFMMLEFCFAGGKFKTAEVIKQFGESRLLRMCILEFLTMNMVHSNDSLTEALKNECKKRNKGFDADGLIYLFVVLRGELSHASTKSESRYRDDKILLPFVAAISTICYLVCGHLQIYGFTSDSGKNELIEQNIKKYSAMLKQKSE